MLPFGLRIAWFCLSLSGLISCWVTLVTFGRAVDALWGPILYCIGCTMMQGIFCLGMIWKMDPFRMPDSFCIVQSVFIGFGTFLMTGVAAAFTLATSFAALKPKRWVEGGKGALVWRPVYIFPVLVFPVVASVVQIAITVRFDTGERSDDLHCEYSNPLWIRFLSYAGVPFLVSIPCSYLSVKSILRILKTNKHLQRARDPGMDIDHFTAIPRRPKEVHIPRVISTSQSSIVNMSSTLQSNREPLSPALSNSTTLASRGFHMPFQPPPLSLDTLNSSISSNPGFDEPDSPVSSSFPTFANPPNAGTVTIDPDRNTIMESTMHPKEDWREMLGPAHSSDLDKHNSLKWEGDGDKSEYGFGKGDDDDVTEDGLSGTCTPRGMQMQRTTGSMALRSRRPLPSLAPAVWRIIFFQCTFTFIGLLMCISTLVDVIKGGRPSPFGTQHVAMILAAWGPFFIFAPLPRSSLRHSYHPFGLPWK